MKIHSYLFILVLSCVANLLIENSFAMNEGLSLEQLKMAQEKNFSPEEIEVLAIMLLLEDFLSPDGSKSDSVSQTSPESFDPEFSDNNYDQDRAIMSSDQEDQDYQPEESITKKRYTCRWGDCKKSYRKSKKFYKHVNRHYRRVSQNACVCKWLVENNKGECIECGHVFRSKCNLKMHLSVHTQERPFKCPMDGCDRRFNQKGELATHIKRHENFRPFVCEKCNRTFVRQSFLNEHRRRHTTKTCRPKKANPQKS